MQPARRRPRVATLVLAPALRVLVVACVALAVLGAQAVGGRHRIEHGGAGTRDPAPSGSTPAAGSPGDPSARPAEAAPPSGHRTDDPTHACAAVDALALGAGPPSAPAFAIAGTPPAAPCCRHATPAPGTASWRCYRARGPPASS